MGYGRGKEFQLPKKDIHAISIDISRKIGDLLLNSITDEDSGIYPIKDCELMALAIMTSASVMAVSSMQIFDAICASSSKFGEQFSLDYIELQSIRTLQHYFKEVKEIKEKLENGKNL